MRTTLTMRSPNSPISPVSDATSATVLRTASKRAPGRASHSETAPATSSLALGSCSGTQMSSPKSGVRAVLSKMTWPRLSAEFPSTRA
ncbi:Uncharacterised protein [Mycobacteroides abscessus subsp. abscessus]|nr:Uncharacterised protein [Mycobacteroides abscessus subsp. abscessus]